MSIVIGDNIQYQGAKPLDARLKYDTVADMKAVADATMYDGCMAYCKEADKEYQWKSTNTVDPTTGKWREFTSGGGGASAMADLTDVDLDDLQDGQVIKWDATQNRWVNDNGGGNVRFLMQTLSAGSISVKFTNLPTTGNNVIDFFTTNGMNYTKIDTSVAGEVTLTYESQLSDVIVYCRIEGVV